MPILLKKNGEITPFRNAEYISAFYFIPKSILDKCGEEINSIPRNPRKLLQDRRAIEVIESDLFKLVIIDAYAFMVCSYGTPPVFLSVVCRPTFIIHGRFLLSKETPSTRIAGGF